jgi:hypothetical protein
MERSNKNEQANTEKGKGNMTVQEAGHLGGHKGGQRVKELVEEGKRTEEEGGRQGTESPSRRA